MPPPPPPTSPPIGPPEPIEDEEDVLCDDLGTALAAPAMVPLDAVPVESAKADGMHVPPPPPLAGSKAKKDAAESGTESEYGTEPDAGVEDEDGDDDEDFDKAELPEEVGSSEEEEEDDRPYPKRKRKPAKPVGPLTSNSRSSKKRKSGPETREELVEQIGILEAKLDAMKKEDGKKTKAPKSKRGK
jgi:hypothetical protein